MSRDDRETGWVYRVAGLAVHALAATAFVFPFGRVSDVLAACFGASLGALLGPTLARTRLRAPFVALVPLAVVGFALVLRAMVVDRGVLASWLGPASALELGDGTLFFLLALSVALLLRAVSTRRPAFAILEVLLVATASAGLVIAHRNGAINRPFEIADPIIAFGGDPTLVFLAVGVVATATAAILLIRERSFVRSLMHFAVLAALVLAVFATTRMLGLPPPPPGGGGVGLRPGEGQPRDGQGGGSRGRPRSHDDESLDFRDNNVGQQSRVPVGVVIFHDEHPAPTGTYYFRQQAFSQYNGSRLVVDVGDFDRDVASSFPTTAPLKIPDPPPPLGRVVVETTVALLAEHTRPFGLEAPRVFAPTRNPDPGRFRRTYRVRSSALDTDLSGLFGARAGGRDWFPETRAHYTAGPEDPRYRALAERILDEELPTDLRAEPIARVVAVTKWLGEHGRYSLRSHHAGADDPTADFLFGDLTGYCVHFAHAATYLFRSLGLPARVGAGYAIDESARQGGTALLLSESDSHAWPEVYFEGVGWVVSDVAPQTVIDPPPPPLDPDLQRLLGELARGEQPMVAPEVKERVLAAARAARAAGWAVTRILVVLFTAFVVLLYAVKISRRFAPLVAGASELPRVLYRAELDRLSDVSLRRERGESRESFAARLREAAPSLAPITRTHLASAFGGRVDDAALVEMRSHARAFRRELRRSLPLWRRALGALVPWSWWLTR